MIAGSLSFDSSTRWGRFSRPRPRGWRDEKVATNSTRQGNPLGTCFTGEFVAHLFNTHAARAAMRLAPRPCRALPNPSRARQGAARRRRAGIPIWRGVRGGDFGFWILDFRFWIGGTGAGSFSPFRIPHSAFRIPNSLFIRRKRMNAQCAMRISEWERPPVFAYRRWSRAAGATPARAEHPGLFSADRVPMQGRLCIEQRPVLFNASARKKAPRPAAQFAGRRPQARCARSKTLPACWRARWAPCAKTS